MKPGISLIGPGKVGCAVASRLHQAGYRITNVVGRSRKSAVEGCRFIGCGEAAATDDFSALAESDIYLLAVPDDQIAKTAAALRSMLLASGRKLLIHFSGLHPAEIMRGPDSGSVSTLSIHPLLPFANRDMASQRLTGCPCALEGDNSALTVGTEIVTAFHGLPFSLDSEKKALYHASACIASNFLVTVLATATDLLAECGLDKREPLQLLLPLVQATLDNLSSLGPEQGLTGPIVRGDIGTVTKHLKALEQARPELLPRYRLLGEMTVHLATQSARLSALQGDQTLKVLGSCETGHR